MKLIFFPLLFAFLIACAPQTEQLDMEEAIAKEPSMEKAVEKSSMEDKQGQAEMEKEMVETMEFGLIAGDISKYYNWDKTKFEQAVKDGKTIYLEFTANWCPVCQNQEPHLKAAFEELDNPDVVGFEIHYKDDETTPEHQSLAQQYQIAYQHSKIVIKNGEIVLKSPESWNKAKFLEEMRKIG